MNIKEVGRTGLSNGCTPVRRTTKSHSVHAVSVSLGRLVSFIEIVLLSNVTRTFLRGGSVIAVSCFVFDKVIIEGEVENGLLRVLHSLDAPATRFFIFQIFQNARCVSPFTSSISRRRLDSVKIHQWTGCTIKVDLLMRFIIFFPFFISE
jgi:hypothetical protein